MVGAGSSIGEITIAPPPENKSINYRVKEWRFAYPSTIISRNLYPPKWTAGQKINEHCKNHPIRKA
jgi:hypothetical protein